jgi:hypothetical protein
MEGVLANRANVNPPLVINRNTNFNLESDSASSQLDPQKEDPSNNDAFQAENDSDPFLTPGARGKRRRVKASANETIKQMFEELQAKRDEEKEAEAALAEEAKGDRRKILDVMTKSQETMSEAVSVLKLMAEKM